MRQLKGVVSIVSQAFSRGAKIIRDASTVLRFPEPRNTPVGRRIIFERFDRSSRARKNLRILTVRRLAGSGLYLLP